MNFFLRPDLSARPEAVLYLNGHIVSQDNTDTIKKRVEELVKEDFTTISLDFSNVEYINSTGIGGIISMYKHVRALEKNFWVINPQPHIEKIFCNLQIDRLFYKK
jgi:anti-anti-sigma factor